LEHGNKGSEIKNALAKASFSAILGGYEQAMVLFWEGEEGKFDLDLQGGERIGEPT